MPPIKILLSAGMIQEGKSGVAQYVIEIARYLSRRRDIELFVAGVAEDRFLFSSLTDAHWEEIPSFFTKSLRNFFWHQFAIPRICKKHAIDLVHIPSYRRILYSCSVPQVVSIHDCGAFRMRNKYDPLRTFFGTKIVPFLARKVEKIIAVSSTTAADVRDYMQINSANIVTIFNGINHDRFHPPRPEMVKLFLEKRKQQEAYFIYVARLEHPSKNHIRLIQAFESYKQKTGSRIQLLLAGESWQGAQTIRERIRQSPYQTDIRELGYVHDEELPFWYAGSLGLIFPSLIEGFGFSVIEAQACGTIVASSNQTSLTEVAGPATLLFDPFKEKEILQVMQTIEQLPLEIRQKMSQQSIHWASQFNWEKTVEQLIEVYKSILDPNQYPLKKSPNQKTIFREDPAILNTQDIRSSKRH